jgi:hypothetical protein
VFFDKPFTEDQFFQLWWAAFGWVLFVIALSVIYRLRKGKPILRPKSLTDRFSETWRSGSSHRNLLTRLGGARNCLWITVTDEEILVGLHFPFNLMFLPEIYGLEYRIRGSDVLSVDELSSFLLGKRMRVRFRSPARGEEIFEVAVKDVNGFRKAVEGIRNV